MKKIIFFFAFAFFLSSCESPQAPSKTTTHYSTIGTWKPALDVVDSVGILHNRMLIHLLYTIDTAGWEDSTYADFVEQMHYQASRFALDTMQLTGTDLVRFTNNMINVSDEFYAPNALVGASFDSARFFSLTQWLVDSNVINVTERSYLTRYWNAVMNLTTMTAVHDTALQLVNEWRAQLPTVRNPFCGALLGIAKHSSEFWQDLPTSLFSGAHSKNPTTSVAAAKAGAVAILTADVFGGLAGGIGDMIDAMMSDGGDVRKGSLTKQVLRSTATGAGEASGGVAGGAADIARGGSGNHGFMIGSIVGQTVTGAIFDWAFGRP